MQSVFIFVTFVFSHLLQIFPDFFYMYIVNCCFILKLKFSFLKKVIENSSPLLQFIDTKI